MGGMGPATPATDTVGERSCEAFRYSESAVGACRGLAQRPLAHGFSWTDYSVKVCVAAIAVDLGNCPEALGNCRRTPWPEARVRDLSPSQPSRAY